VKRIAAAEFVAAHQLQRGDVLASVAWMSERTVQHADRFDVVTTWPQHPRPGHATLGAGALHTLSEKGAGEEVIGRRP
jgi:hypothetical protein